MPLVFVYGTLMRAGANHSVLVRLGCTFAGRATTRERWTLVDLGPYPALLPAREGAPVATTHVSGEVWRLDDRALRELDAFEGCPELYTRERIALSLESAEVDNDNAPPHGDEAALSDAPPHGDEETPSQATRPEAAPGRRHLATRDFTAFAYVLAAAPPSDARVIASGRYAAAGTTLPRGAAPEQPAPASERRAAESKSTRRRRR